MTVSNPDDELRSVLRSLEYSLKSESKSPHTIRQYTYTFSRYVGACGMKYDKATVVQYLSGLQAGMSEATVAHHFGGLKAVFKWLEEEGVIESNPFALLKGSLRKPTVHETQKDVVPAEKMTEVLRWLDSQKRYRDAAIVSLFWDTGMRVSELCDITIDDVDFDDCLITLRQTKNGRIRVVPFGPSTARRMDRWVRNRTSRSPFFFTHVGGRTPGARMMRSGVLQMVKPVFERLGMPGISPHDLRHTFATHFMEHPDARVDDLQTIAGWSDIKMAQRYTKQRREARAFAAHKRLSPVERG